MKPLCVVNFVKNNSNYTHLLKKKLNKYINNLIHKKTIKAVVLETNILKLFGPKN